MLYVGTPFGLKNTFFKASALQQRFDIQYFCLFCIHGCHPCVSVIDVIGFRDWSAFTKAGLTTSNCTIVLGCKAQGCDSYGYLC